MSFAKDLINLDFSDPKFSIDVTNQPIWPNNTYTIKYLPNFPINIIYFTTKNSELSNFLSTFKTAPFIIIEPYDHNKNELFRFSIINQDYCLIISIISQPPPYLYIFIKSITTAVTIFPNQKLKQMFESFFHVTFYHYQYYNDSYITQKLIKYLIERPKIGDFFYQKVNHDPKIKFRLSEAISQVINSVFAYYVKRHDFFRYKIKMDHFVDFSRDYQVLNTIFSCPNYDVNIVFHSVCNMMFIYKRINGEERGKKAYREKDIDNNNFNSIIQIIGLFQTDTSFVLVYEYIPLYKITDDSFSSKTVDNCLLNLLEKIDNIHKNEYTIKTLTSDSVLFSLDNSIFFCNYHEFEKASYGFEYDLYNFGIIIRKAKCHNKYLIELSQCSPPNSQQSEIERYVPCLPVTQYFIFRTKKNFSNFNFDENRKDNKILFDFRNQKSIGALKTLIFCYANRDQTYLKFLEQLPNVNEYYSTYISIGEEMLDFYEEKGIQILKCVTENKLDNSRMKIIKDEANYIIGRFYFFKKDYLKTQEYFGKIKKDAKIFYILGRMYQMNLFSNSTGKNMIAIDYFNESEENQYWRTYYRKGLYEMEKNNFKDAISLFDNAEQLSEKDKEGDEKLFGLLSDDFDYLYGMIPYNLAICYKKINKFDKMKDYFLKAIDRKCKLAYAPLSYIYFVDQEYEKSYEFVKKALDFLPLNLKLVIDVIFSYINLMINADRPDDARKMLNLAIKLYSNSHNCNESSQNVMIRNIQKYATIVANMFYSRNRISDSYVCYALSAAFGYCCGFIGLAKIYSSHNKQFLTTLVCIKHFFELYYRYNKDEQFINAVNELISMYPIYMQRKCYFELGTLLFNVSKSPYIPFDFLIKASYLTCQDVTVSDIKFENQIDNKAQIVIDSILKHYQNIVEIKNDNNQESTQKQQKLEEEEEPVE